MRAILLLALLVGCADDGPSDPHEIVDCVGYPIAVNGCEVACADYGNRMEVDCPAQGGTCANGTTLDDGSVGCCTLAYEGQDVPRIRWEACE